MDNTALALQNQAAINAQFAQGLAPLSNYAAQNLQLGIAQQRAEQERAQRIYEMQLQQQFAKEREAAQYDYNRRLAAQAEAAYFNTNMFIQESTAKREESQTRLNFTLQDQKLKDAEANALRENPDVKRILGPAILNQFKDTPEGNAALISKWHETTANPAIQEDLAAGKAETLAKQIKTTIGGMTALNPGSPEAKEAVRTFLSQPGVVDMLIKKGDLTQQDVINIQQGGDPSKVFSAIRAVGDNSFWSMTGDTRTATLLTAWNNALIQSKAAPSGEQMARMNYLQGLMKNLDTIMPSLTSEGSYQRLSKAFGVTRDETKTPPPPKQIGSGIQIQSNAATPFGAPNTTIPGGVGLSGLTGQSPTADANAKAFSVVSAISSAHPEIGQTSLRAAAFHPQPYASDPATDYSVRQKLLDTFRQASAEKAGIKEGFLLQKPQPYYDAFQQTRDEQALQNFVKGLYTPQSAPPNALQNPFGPQ